ncbi:DNA-binding MarR family transcriptional regulator [Bacillus sp. SLBN-46]|jgi:DNA-binding MarR family transcriptional regulator|uniref:MarR family winged helix-turn-helix transcriptional regulator n=1 Tax=Bacillus sp. SLBN-46 TaxID=3042283 RepID=UPI00285C7C15|nr:MarR family transcriptional regulator [Bacillus sp. SLBN-46]MDR6125332.1 DNA-binding MarR family transcriptional regulator [Bacillus sp. SLBN-46]
MNEEEQILIHCLYFTASRFARNISKLAEKTFDFGELAPSYLYMIMIVKFHPEINQKDLCHKLSIAPSTSTRFIDKLEKLKLVTRKIDGKQTHISLTDEGEKVYHQFRVSLKELFLGYSDILGREFSMDLSRMLHEASNKLEKEL